jgi:hypothetical protein
MLGKHLKLIMKGRSLPNIRQKRQLKSLLAHAMPR